MNRYTAPEETRALIAEAEARISEWSDTEAAPSDVQLIRRLADALGALLPVPDGDAREAIRLELGKHDFDEVDGECECGWDAWEAENPDHQAHIADAILAAVTVPSRDIAAEIEAEAERYTGPLAQGLRRAAEIVRRGR